MLVFSRLVMHLRGKTWAEVGGVGGHKGSRAWIACFSSFRDTPVESLKVTYACALLPALYALIHIRSSFCLVSCVWNGGQERG